MDKNLDKKISETLDFPPWTQQQSSTSTGGHTPVTSNTLTVRCMFKGLPSSAKLKPTTQTVFCKPFSYEGARKQARKCHQNKGKTFLSEIHILKGHTAADHLVSQNLPLATLSFLLANKHFAPQIKPFLCLHKGSC